MKHAEGSFQGMYDTPIFYQSWQPEKETRGVILLVHGLGEHGGRYPKVIQALVPKGFAIYALDHRGHGRSGNAGAAHVMDFGEFRTDLHIFRQMVEGWERNRPFFIYGHSMGGLITLNYALHHPQRLDGVIASAPAVGNLPIPLHLRLISQLLSKVAPTLQIDTGLDAAAISRIPAVQQAYLDDPLVHHKATPRFGTELHRAAQWTMSNASEFEPPLLLVHGDADTLVPLQSSRDFFAKVIQPDKQLITYPDGVHESHNDLHADQLTTDLLHWLEAHL